MPSTALRGTVAAAAILAASTAFAGVNLISDGDFSNPNQGGNWTIYSPGTNGWTSTVGDGIEIGYSPIYGLPTDNAGGQNLELNANIYGTDSYTVSGLQIGATYDLSWDYGGRTSGGPSSATVSFGGAVLANDSGSIGMWTHNVVPNRRNIHNGEHHPDCGCDGRAELRQRVHQLLVDRSSRSLDLGNVGPRPRGPRLRRGWPRTPDPDIDRVISLLANERKGRV